MIDYNELKCLLEPLGFWEIPDGLIRGEGDGFKLIITPGITSADITVTYDDPDPIDHDTHVLQNYTAKDLKVFVMQLIHSTKKMVAAKHN